MLSAQERGVSSVLFTFLFLLCFQESIPAVPGAKLVLYRLLPRMLRCKSKSFSSGCTCERWPGVFLFLAAPTWSHVLIFNTMVMLASGNLKHQVVTSERCHPNQLLEPMKNMFSAKRLLLKLCLNRF